jgi:hypothetical protein
MTDKCIERVVGATMFRSSRIYTTANHHEWRFIKTITVSAYNGEYKKQFYCIFCRKVEEK